MLIEEISHIPMKFVAAGGTFSASVSEEHSSCYIWGTGSFG